MLQTDRRRKRDGRRSRYGKRPNDSVLIRLVIWSRQGRKGIMLFSHRRNGHIKRRTNWRTDQWTDRRTDKQILLQRYEDSSKKRCYDRVCVIAFCPEGLKCLLFDPKPTFTIEGRLGTKSQGKDQEMEKFLSHLISSRDCKTSGEKRGWKRLWALR